MTLPADLASDEAKTVYFFRDEVQEVQAADEAAAALSVTFDRSRPQRRLRGVLLV